VPPSGEIASDTMSRPTSINGRRGRPHRGPRRVRPVVRAARTEPRQATTTHGAATGPRERRRAAALLDVEDDRRAILSADQGVATVRGRVRERRRGPSHPVSANVPRSSERSTRPSAVAASTRRASGRDGEFRERRRRRSVTRVPARPSRAIAPRHAVAVGLRTRRRPLAESATASDRVFDRERRRFAGHRRTAEA
jgi:hypothetical protein